MHVFRKAIVQKSMQLGPFLTRKPAGDCRKIVCRSEGIEFAPELRLAGSLKKGKEEIDIVCTGWGVLSHQMLGGT